ncbi:MAG: DUF4340 domain-containing protein [Gammaproteobacteria bacterium]|nr:DUF4340 domain-containing protein [Gammaproteobacteria bacterium]
MTRRSLIVLGVVGAALVAVLLLTRLEFSGDDSLGVLHAPGLADRLGELESLRVTRAGNEVVATIERTDRDWGVAERGGHPVDFERFRGSLLALSEARRVERKTALAEFYPRIGVEDVGAPDAGGYLLELGYGGGRPEDRFILGHRAGTGMIYIRTAGEEQSWMVSAELSLSDETRDWVDRDIIDLGSGEVRRVALDRGEGDRLEIAKDDRDDINFTPRDIPEGRELSYGSVANSIAGALANVEANDVRPAAEVAALPRAVLARYETFEGLELELDVREEPPAGDDADPRYWALFSASAAESAVPEEPTVSVEAAIPEEPAVGAEDAGPETSPVTAEERAGELNAALAGWAYELPGYKSDQWFKKMDDLLKEE